MKLTIELVPSTCFFSNVRSCVSPENWDKLRRKSYQEAGYLCEICGGKGSSHPVECHEVWHYDDKNKKQTLVRMIALCPQCHAVKHIGLARMRGQENEAIKHLMKVNALGQKQAEDYVKKCFEKWRSRSRFDWDLDLSYLDGLGVEWHSDRHGCNYDR